MDFNERGIINVQKLISHPLTTLVLSPGGYDF